MRHLKIFGGIFFVFWLFALVFTYSHTFYWYAYLVISSIALALAALLLYHAELLKIIDRSENVFSFLKHKPAKPLTYDDDEYYDVTAKKRKRKRKRKKATSYIDSNQRERKSTRDYRFTTNEHQRYTSIRNKEYLHTKIPQLYNGDKQQLLFETIQRYKENNLFTNYYAGVTNDDLISRFDEYENRNIFELYDNMIPNTYAKVLYDQRTDTNRIGIFLTNLAPNSEDDFLGFIALEDSYRADLLLRKYTDIQIFPTILGGTYKRVYRNNNGDIKIVKDFINYDLTISLAFYNT